MTAVDASRINNEISLMPVRDIASATSLSSSSNVTRMSHPALILPTHIRPSRSRLLNPLHNLRQIHRVVVQPRISIRKRRDPHSSNAPHEAHTSPRLHTEPHAQASLLFSENPPSGKPHHSKSKYPRPPHTNESSLAASAQACPSSSAESHPGRSAPCQYSATLWSIAPVSLSKICAGYPSFP